MNVRHRIEIEGVRLYGNDPINTLQLPRGALVYPFSPLYLVAGLTVFSPGCYSRNSRRGSSVVEQPIRNRQVVGSTPTLGSIRPGSGPDT